MSYLGPPISLSGIKAWIHKTIPNRAANTNTVMTQFVNEWL